MKSGLIIGGVAAVVIAALIVWLFLGSADPPTQATRGSALEKVTLPGDLRPLYEVTDTGTSASDLYNEAIDYYIANESAIDRSPQGSEARYAAELLAKAASAGRITEGYLDARIPMMPMARSDVKAAIQRLPLVAIKVAGKLSEQGQREEAKRLAQGAFAFGLRAFQHNARLWARYEGLQTMGDGATAMYNYGPMEDPLNEACIAWERAAREIQNKWDPKWRVLMSTRPQIGDTLNMAYNDKDRSFRIEATATLGICKMNPGSQGNIRAIEAAIRSLKNSDDEMIKAAAEAADAVDAAYIRGL